ncbi:MAG: hypothetical protein ACREBC_03530, partial [Pyrinomonadaceae bacterium]
PQHTLSLEMEVRAKSDLSLRFSSMCGDRSRAVLLHSPRAIREATRVGFPAEVIHDARNVEIGINLEA